MTAEWVELAACRDVDGELFYPVSVRAELAQPAKSVCRRCPVKAECLQYALDTGEREGIWGGLTPGERSAYANGHAHQPCRRCGKTFVPRLRGQKRCPTCAKTVDKRRTGPTVACPTCQQSAGINPKTGRIARHRTPGNRHDRPYCTADRKPVPA